MFKLAAVVVFALAPTATFAAGCLYTGDGATLELVNDKYGAAIAFVVGTKGRTPLDCTLYSLRGKPDPVVAGWPSVTEAMCNTGPGTPTVLRGEFAMILSAPDLPPPTALYFAGRVFYPSADCNDAAGVSRNLPADLSADNPSDAPKADSSPVNGAGKPDADSGPLANHEVHTVTVRPDGSIVP